MLLLQRLLGALACLCIASAAKTLGFSPYSFRRGNDFGNLRSALVVTLPASQETVFDNGCYDEIFADRWQKMVGVFEQVMDATSSDEAGQLWKKARYLCSSFKASIADISRIDTTATLSDVDRMSDIAKSLSRMDDDITTMLDWWHSLPEESALHETPSLQFPATDDDAFQSGKGPEADSTESPSREPTTEFEAAPKSHRPDATKVSTPQSPSEKASSSRGSDKSKTRGLNKHACPAQPFPPELSKYFASIEWTTFDPKDACLPCFKSLDAPKTEQLEDKAKQDEPQKPVSQQQSAFSPSKEGSASNCWTGTPLQVFSKIFDMFSGSTAADKEYPTLYSRKLGVMHCEVQGSTDKKSSDSQRTKSIMEINPDFDTAKSKYAAEQAMAFLKANLAKRGSKSMAERILACKQKWSC